MIAASSDVMLNMLKDIDVEKVSLVNRPAIRRRFLVFKEEGVKDMQNQYISDLDDILSRLNKAEKSDKSKILKELGDLVTDLKDAVADESTEVAESVIKSAIERLDAVVKSDEITADDLGELATALNGILEKINVEEVVEVIEEEMQVEDNTMIEKAGFPEDIQEKVVELVKSESERIAKAAEEEKKELLERLQKSEQEQESQRERIEKMQADATRREWLVKAEKEFSNLPGKAEEIVELLMKFEKIDKEATDKLVDILKAVDNQVDQSGFFKEIGTGVRSEGSATSKIEAIAKEKVEKSGGTLDMVQAKAQAWKENPELRREESN